MTKLNLNQKVRIKLTPFGKTVYQDHHYPEQPADKIDNEDCVKIELWRLAYIFGQYLTGINHHTTDVFVTVNCELYE